MFFSVITKNLNWGILKGGIGLRMKNCYSLKKLIFRRGFLKNQYMGGIA